MFRQFGQPFGSRFGQSLGLLNGSGFVPRTYTFNIPFTVADAPPISNPYAGLIGNLRAVDTNSAIGAGGNVLFVDGTPAAQDGLISSDSGGTATPFTRTPGNVLDWTLFGRYSLPSGTKSGLADNVLTSVSTRCGGQGSALAFSVYDQGSVLRTVTLGSGDYRFFCVMRSTGARLLVSVDGGAPQLLWIYPGGTATLYDKVTLVNGATQFCETNHRLFPYPALADDYADCTIHQTPVSGTIYTAQANGFTQQAFVLPAVSAGLKAVSVKTRVVDASNYYETYLKGNAGGTAWDLFTDKVIAGAPTTLKTNLNVGTPTRLIVGWNSNAYETYTDISSGSTARGSGSDSTYPTQTGISVSWDASVTIGSLDNWALTNSLYTALITQGASTLIKMLGVGDSKMTTTYPWFELLQVKVAAAHPVNGIREAPARQPQTGSAWAVSGGTVSSTRTGIDALIAAATTVPDKAIIELGANDLPAGSANYTLNGTDPTSVTWKANYTYIINALLTWNPSMQIWLSLPWRQTFNTACDTICDTLIPAIIAGCSNPSNLHLGVDQRVYLKGADDGATNTVDGIHPNAAGQLALAQQYALLVA